MRTSLFSSVIPLTLALAACDSPPPDEEGGPLLVSSHARLASGDIALGEDPTTGDPTDDEVERAYSDCDDACDARCYNVIVLYPLPGAHLRACAEPCDAAVPDGAVACPQSQAHPAACVGYPDPDPDAKLHGVCALRCDGGYACPEGMDCRVDGDGPDVCLWQQ